MISRNDFVFTIGYEGNTAVVDGPLKKRYGGLNTEQLAEQGLYKQALSLAIYEQATGASRRPGDQGEDGGEDPAAVVLERILAIYNRNADYRLGSVEDLKRVFGVFEVPEGVGKVLVV